MQWWCRSTDGQEMKIVAELLKEEQPRWWCRNCSAFHPAEEDQIWGKLGEDEAVEPVMEYRARIDGRVFDFTELVSRFSLSECVPFGELSELRASFLRGEGAATINPTRSQSQQRRGRRKRHR